MITIKSDKLANYWNLELPERKRIQTAYWMLCVAENEQFEAHEECDCGNCYFCRYAKAFTMPDYEMPLM